MYSLPWCMFPVCWSYYFWFLHWNILVLFLLLFLFCMYFNGVKICGFCCIICVVCCHACVYNACDCIDSNTSFMVCGYIIAKDTQKEFWDVSDLLKHNISFCSSRVCCLNELQTLSKDYCWTSEIGWRRWCGSMLCARRGMLRAVYGLVCWFVAESCFPCSFWMMNM